MKNEQEIEFNYEQLEVKLAIAQGDKCDKYDYMIATFCGVACGLVDAFLVGKPNFREVQNSALGTLTDEAANKFTGTIADMLIRKDDKVLQELTSKGLKGKELTEELEKRGIPGNFKRKGDVSTKYSSLSEKITYLENKFKVSYDQSTNDKIIGNDVNITPDNHHLKSLAHSPDIIGLFFSILDQFTLKTSFVEDGKVIRVVPTKRGVELRGNDMMSKLYCAVVNWLGHLLSDFCGSHSSSGRGDGIPIPFFEIFEFCDFGSFVDPDGGNFTISELAMEVYEQGYDARHAAAMAIPVVLCDLMIKLIWSLKRHFYSKYEWKECIPTKKHSDLRVMLIVGNMSLCIVDGADAWIRSQGNIIEICLHLNIIAWYKFAKRVLKELELRCGFTYEDLKSQYQYLDLQLTKYIEKLKNVDYVRLDSLIAESDDILVAFSTNDMEQINSTMMSYIEEQNIAIQFKTDEEFLELMDDDDTILKL